MIINGQDLLDLSPFKPMLDHKEKANGYSHGLAEIGYDVRLRETIKYFPPVSFAYLMNLYHSNKLTQENLNKAYKGYIHITYEDGSQEEIIGNACLGSTIEEWSVPTNVGMYIKDKSSHIRQLYHVGNTVAEPGWNGVLTLELFFFAQKPITLKSGTGIAQVIAHELSSSADYGSGKYQNQGPKPTKAILA